MKIKKKEKYKIRFNPYFNGYSTLTTLSNIYVFEIKSFNPYFNGYSTLTPSS